MTNVAVVVLDTLRKDSFDEFFDWHPGLRFENAWSTSGWTVPAHASLFAGRYPSELGVHAKSAHLDCAETVLAERLSAEGYTTRAFSANAFVSEAFDYDRGFDEFQTYWRGGVHGDDVVDWPEFVSETRGEGPTRFVRALYRCFAGDYDTLKSIEYGVRMKAKDLGIDAIGGHDHGTREALEFVRDTTFGDDEFLFLNLMEAHTPYDPPEEYRTVTLEAYPDVQDTVSEGDTDLDAATVRQAYDDAVRYLSDVYRDIFDELTADFEYVITLGDHGELFGEYGVWAHNHGIYPELTHVPLVVYDGDTEREHVDDTVGILDVHRTVLVLAGLEAVESRGRDLLGRPPAAEQLVERRGFRPSAAETLREDGVDEDRIERYDRPLTGMAAPESYYGCETVDGFVERGTATARDIRERLAELRDSLDVVDVTEDEAVPDDVQRRLEDLGYV